MRVSAGGVVIGPEKKLLLVHQHGDSWSFPKGGVEEGESYLTAAKREIKEETGIDDLVLVDELGEYERYSLGPGGVGEVIEWGMRKRVLFLFETPQSVAKSDDKEITDVRWVTVDEALQLLTHPKDREFLASVRGTIQQWIH